MRNRFALHLGALVVALVLLVPGLAQAYPWMIRHDYTVCTACHTDPSGGNLLTAYGRSLSQTLLSSELLAKRDQEPGKFKDFAFGLVPLPEEALQVGAFLRSGYISNYANGEKLDARVLNMRADVEAHVALGNFRVDGTIGVLPYEAASSAREAWVNRVAKDDPAIVARTFWAGYSLFDGDALARVGRMNLPFGLRNIEHASWVRAETHTDINQHQQVGASYYWTGEDLRAEVMAVAGNFQIRPDDMRERGLVGYVEQRLASKQALALQAQVLRSSADRLFGTSGSLLRQSYGAFYRAAILDELAVMAEANLLVNTFETAGTELGHVAFLQADYEPFPGVHVMGTLEEKKTAVAGADQGLGGWLSSAYFPVPHLELRADGIYRKVADRDPILTLLFQGQLYL